MRPRSKELIPITMYSVTVRPDDPEDSNVCAFEANCTSVMSEIKIKLIFRCDLLKIFSTQTK